MNVTRRRSSCSNTCTDTDRHRRNTPPCCQICVNKFDKASLQCLKAGTLQPVLPNNTADITPAAVPSNKRTDCKPTKGPPQTNPPAHLLGSVEVHLSCTGLDEGTAANGSNVHTLARQPVPRGQGQIQPVSLGVRVKHGPEAVLVTIRPRQDVPAGQTTPLAQSQTAPQNDAADTKGKNVPCIEKQCGCRGSSGTCWGGVEGAARGLQVWGKHSLCQQRDLVVHPELDELLQCEVKEHNL